MSVSLNQLILEKFFKDGDFKVIHQYAVVSSITANKGYMSVGELSTAIIELCGISQKTVDRWLESLHKFRFINIKKNIVYVKGKKTIEPLYETNNIYIKFYDEHLKSYNDFKNHFIRQDALQEQRRFAFAIRKNKKNIDADSLVNSGKVETSLAVVKNSKKAGAAISILTKKLNADKMTISRALKGSTEPQFNTTFSIKVNIARVKYPMILSNFKGMKEYSSKKWSFSYNKKDDSYRLHYRLANKILANSCIVRRKSYKNNNNKLQYISVVNSYINVPIFVTEGELPF